MAKPKLILSPHVIARERSGAKEAWWYENAKSIDIYIRDSLGIVVSARITRRALKSWLARTEPK